jgi:integrase
MPSFGGPSTKQFARVDLDQPGRARISPRVRAPQIQPPAPAGVIQLIEEAAADDPDLGCFLHLAATTGARRGELCALRWRDVDLTPGTMTIRRAVVEDARSVVIEKDTKTHAARHIAPDPDTVVAVHAHRQRMASRAPRLRRRAHVGRAGLLARPRRHPSLAAERRDERSCDSGIASGSARFDSTI